VNVNIGLVTGGTLKAEIPDGASEMEADFRRSPDVGVLGVEASGRVFVIRRAAVAYIEFGVE
jgi:hypothetical protein